MEKALQHIVNRFSNVTKNFGLTISLKETCNGEQEGRDTQGRGHNRMGPTMENERDGTHWDGGAIGWDLQWGTRGMRHNGRGTK